MASGHEIEQAVFEVAAAIASELNLILVDVVYRGGQEARLQVIIYRDRGVTVDNCEAFSRRLGDCLDAEDVIDRAYTLEVSSPGLERKLRHRHEYDLFEGKRIRIVCRGPIEGRVEWSGELVGLVDDHVMLRGADPEDIRIPLASIKRAQLVY